MTSDLKEKLRSLAEEEYRIFITGLLPKVDNILGVRLPVLRKLAKEIANGDWRGFLASSLLCEISGINDEIPERQQAGRFYL